MKDSLYLNNSPEGDFQFDQRVVDVFENMIQRSVPGYMEIAKVQSAAIPHFYQAGTKLYDLGVSTGNSLYSLAQKYQHPMNIVGIDASQAMIDRLKAKQKQDKLPFQVELRCERLQQSQFEPASVVLLNFTLQFLPKEDRLVLLKKIYNALVPGGILLISEKVKSTHPKIHQAQVEIHHDFKRDSGYTEAEIIRKRDAIENVLVPNTKNEHEERFSQVGFSAWELTFKWFNFASWICIKD